MSDTRRVDLAALAPQRWRNGAGVTREIAVGGAAARFDWRLSVAEVEQDAPFSPYPGVDRGIVVMRGAGMTLCDEAGATVHELQPLMPWHFAGERPLQARLPHGPCQGFNVMTRRGAWQAQLQVVRGAATVAPDEVVLLLVARGRWWLDGDHFMPGQGLLRQGAGAPIAARASEGGDDALLQVRLRPVARP